MENGERSWAGGIDSGGLRLFGDFLVGALLRGGCSDGRWLGESGLVVRGDVSWRVLGGGSVPGAAAEVAFYFAEED